MSTDYEKKKKRKNTDLISENNQRRRQLRSVEIVIIVVALIIGARYLVALLNDLEEGAQVATPSPAVRSTAEASSVDNTPVVSTVSSWIDVGKQHHEVARYDDAVAAYNEAITLANAAETPSAEAFYRRGLSFYQLSDYDPAIADFTRAIEFEYEPVDFAYYFRGRSYQFQGNNTRALENFNTSIELCSAECHFDRKNRGDVYLAMENFEAAARDYEHAIELEPEYLLAYDGLIESYEALGNDAQALNTQAAAMRVRADRIVDLELSDGLINAELLDRNEQARVSLEGRTGQRLKFSLNAQRGLTTVRRSDLAPVVLVTGPDGQPLIYREGRHGETLDDSVDLTEDGNYIVTVGSVKGLTKGAFQLKLSLE